MDNATPDPRHLLAFIRDAETSRGYDDWSGFARISPPRPVSQMTVGEIKDWQQRNIKAGAESTAIGGYQMISKTFAATAAALNLSDDTVFSAEVQDQMGLHLLNGRGYQRWAAGEMSDEKFMDAIAAEWAALPMATGPKRGRSRYAGDGLNASTRGLSAVSEVLMNVASGTEWTGETPVPTGPATRQSEKIGDFLDDRDTSSFGMPRPGYISTRDQYLADQQGGRERVGFFEGSGAAIRNEWSLSWLVRQQGQEQFMPDPEWMRQGLSEEFQHTIQETLPQRYHTAFEGATSEAHAGAILERLQADWETEQKLDSMGWAGFGLRLGAAFTDPIGIALSVVSAGYAAPAIYGQRATRARNALQSGSSAAAINAAVEGIIVSQDVSRSADNIIYAAGAGFVLGGAIGAFRSTPEDVMIARAVNNTMREVEAQNPNLQTSPGPGGPSSMGAMDNRPAPALSPSEHAEAMSANAPRSAMGAVRFDMVGRLKQSEVGVVRRLGGMMGEEGVGNADRSVVGRGATEEVRLELNRRMTRFYRSASPEYREWAKKNSRNILNMKHRDEFFSNVGRAVRRPLDATDDPNVKAVAARVKAELADLLEFAKSKGIRGFDEVVENQNYLTRQFNLRRLDDMIAKHGMGSVNRLVAESMISSNRKARNAGKNVADVDYEDALRLSAAYVKSIRSRRFNMVETRAAMSGKDKEKITELLQEAIGRHEVGPGQFVDIELDDVARLVDGVIDDARPADAGRIARAKFRMDLDEEYGLRSPSTGDTPYLSIEDLLDNNVENLFQNYTRQVVGAGVMEDVLENFRVPNADGTMGERPTWNQVLSYGTDEAQRKGGKAANKMRGDLKRLDLLYKIVTGRPVQEHTAGSEVLRMLRDYQFLRVAGQMGLASIPEVGSLVAQGGVRVLLQNIPELRNIFTLARNGKFDTRLAQEIDEIWSSGTDPIRRSPGYITDDYARAGGDVFGRDGVRQADFLMQQAGEVVSVAGGLDHVNMFLQRFASRTAVQSFMNAAERGRAPLSKSRMRSIGIDEDDMRRISEQMKKYVGTQKGMLGSKVRSLNIENWDDPQAAAKFIQAVDRWSNSMAMIQDAGTLPGFMSQHLGKSVGQFRSFMMSAYTKMLLAGIHHRDMTTATAFFSTMFFASLGYVAQTHLNTLGLADREEQLDERLTPQAIAAASFQRSGFSTFIPAVVDQIAAMGGEDPVFQYRTTDLSTGIFGNPTLDFFDNVQKAGQGVSASLINPDYDFSQRDWRSVSSLFALQNALLIRNVNSLIGEDLPLRSK